MTKPTPPDSVDIAIVGGGPAGVVAAISAIKKDVSVAIFDRKPIDLIGEKVCGDALDIESLDFIKEHLGLPYPSGASVSDDIHDLVLGTNKDAQDLIYEGPGFVVDRLAYGQVLLQLAINSGVQVYSESRIIEPVISDNQCTGILWQHNGTKGTTNAKVVIDASGTIATLRKKLPEDFEPTIRKGDFLKYITVTYREIIELNDKDVDHDWRNEIFLYFAPEFPPTGYFWIFTKGAHHLNVGAIFPKRLALDEKRGLSVRELYQHMMSQYYDPSSYKVLVTGGGRIPVSPPLDNAVADGLIIAGDAACHANPVTAEGHGPALIAGYFAGYHAAKGVLNNNVSKTALWQYNKDVMHEFGAKHGVSFVIAEMIRNIGHKRFAWMIEKQIVTGAELKRIAENPGQSFTRMQMFGKFLKSLPNPLRLISLRKTTKLSLQVHQHYLDYPSQPEQFDEWVEERNKLLPTLIDN